MNQQCFSVALQRMAYPGDRKHLTVVASTAIVAINKSIAVARRESGSSRWYVTELQKVGDITE